MNSFPHEFKWNEQDLNPFTISFFFIWFPIKTPKVRVSLFKIGSNLLSNTEPSFTVLNILNHAIALLQYLPSILYPLQNVLHFEWNRCERKHWKSVLFILNNLIYCGITYALCPVDMIQSIKIQLDGRKAIFTTHFLLFQVLCRI